MRIMITKDIPNKHRVKKFGIFRPMRKTRNGIWITAPTGFPLLVKRGEFIYVEGDKVKLSEIARTVKYLEILKWKLMLPDFKSRHKFEGGRPIETVVELCELPWGSAFCFLFRDIKTKHKIDGKYCTCFCPKKPWCHADDWGRYSHPNSPEKPHISCILDREGNIRPPTEIIKEIQEIDIMTIMEFVKKIKDRINQDKLRSLACKWHFHVWHKITIPRIDRVSKDFVKGYER